MSSLVETAPSAPSVADATNEELRAELADQLTLTAHALSRAAIIWTELQRRGVDLAALRSGLAYYLPRIARGELAAEAVVAFAGQRMLLQHLVGMPLDDQRRYASGAALMVAVQDDKGQIVGEERRMVELTAREVVLSIAEGRVRALPEQRRTIARQLAKPTRKRTRTGSTARVRADVETGTVRVGAVRLEPLDLAGALRALGYELRRVGALNDESSAPGR